MFKNKMNDNNSQNNRLATKPHLNPSLMCYNCKEKGHPYLKCNKPLLKCDNCHKIGHKTENCLIKQGDQSIKVNAVAKTMCIGI